MKMISTIIQTIVRYMFEKTRCFMDVVIIILLTLSSIYSVYSIVYKFLFDNITTSTIVKTCDNILPFAQYLTVFYSFVNYTVFPETWVLNETDCSTLLQSDSENGTQFWSCWARRVELRRREKIFSPHYLSRENISLEGMIDVASATGVIDLLDYKFMDGITRDKMFGRDSFSKPELAGAFFSNLSAGLTAYVRESTYGNLSGPINPAVIAAIDTFIENEHADALVDETISRILGPNPIRILTALVANATEHIPVSVFLDVLSPNSLQISIPLDFISGVSAQRISLAMFPFDQTSAAPVFSRVHYNFVPYGGPLTVLPLRLARLKPIIHSSLNFQNSAVYNSMGVRSDDHCGMCKDLTSIEQCRFKCVLDEVVDLCHCVPFSYRRLYYSDFHGNKFPRCTMKRYGECLRSAKYQPRRCAGGRVVPCVTKQNTFELVARNFGTADEFRREKNDDDYILANQTYRHYIDILLKQKMYVLFEDRFQDTLMEMFGQVGGNLGIFLSFSLYGVWKVAVICYLAYKRHRERNSKGSAQHIPLGIITSWLQLAKLNIEMEAATRIRGSAPIEQHQLDDILLQIRDHHDKLEKLRLERQLNDIKVEEASGNHAVIEQRLRSLEAHQRKS